jgi:hypothetical protein
MCSTPDLNSWSVTQNNLANFNGLFLRNEIFAGLCFDGLPDSVCTSIAVGFRLKYTGLKPVEDEAPSVA